MNKNETITKLTELNELLNEFSIENNKTDNKGLVREYLSVFYGIKDKTGLPKKVPSVFNNFPNYNYTYYEIDNLEIQRKDILKKSAILAIAAVVCFLISKISFKLRAFMYIAVVLFGIVLYLGNKVNKVAKEYNEKKVKNDKAIEQFNKENNAFLEALENFEKEKEKGLAEALVYKEKSAEALKECNVMMEKYLNECNQSEQRQKELIEQINQYDFVPTEYLQYVPTVLSLLKSGRADDYKEALNLAIQEEREAQERAERAAEERRRTEIAERQAEEERRHNMQMEEEQAIANKVQAEHNRAMENAERQRVRNAEYAQKREQEAYSRARETARMRCNSCKKASHCSMKSRGMENCAAFEPR